MHRSGRRSLLTPLKVAGGPNAKTPLKNVRITRGKYFVSGRTFKIIDDRTTRANAHRFLEGSWIGTTDFREVAEFVDDDWDEEVKVKELGECLANPLTEVPNVGLGKQKTAPKETEDPAEESMKEASLSQD